MSAASDRNGGLSRPGPWLAAILVLAAGVRCLCWWRMVALFDDGPVFIYIAEAMAEGDWSAVLRHPYHPLYSLAIWLAGPLHGDLETTGAVVSIAAGTACVALLFVFLRDAFDARVGLIGATLLALHPAAVTFSSDVQSDALYTALFLASACLAWRALRDVRVGLAGAAGALAGLAYLVRPEGLGVAMAGIAGGAWLGLSGSWGRGRAALWCAVFAIGVAATAAPYVVALRLETGVWTVTQKKSLENLTSFGSRGSLIEPVAPGSGSSIPSNGPLPAGPGADSFARSSSAIERGLVALAELYDAAATGLRFELLGFLAVGLWLARGRPGRRGLFIGALIVLYAVVLFALGASAGYVSQRYTLPPLLLLFGYAALGVPALGSAVLRGLGRLASWLPGAADGRSRLPAGPVAGTALSLAFVFFFFLPLDLEPRRAERLAERRAAEWLRETAPEPRVVAARRLRAAYYADASYVPVPTGGYPPEQLLRYLRSRGARYLIIEEGRVDRHEGLREARELGMQRLHRTQIGGRVASVYAIRPEGAR